MQPAALPGSRTLWSARVRKAGAPSSKPSGSLGASMAGEEVLVFDVKLKRPACVLLQAAYGCSPYGAVMKFDSETWLVMPTDDMRRIKGTKEQWERLAAVVNAQARQERS